MYLFCAPLLFIGLLVMLELGRRIGTRRRIKDPKGSRLGIGVIEGAIFSIAGLLIAFTFSGAANRFDARRQMIVKESNAIGTAWQRLHVLAPERTTELQGLFRDYLDSRISSYQKLPNVQAAEEEAARSIGIQEKIWNTAIQACDELAGKSPAHMLLLPSLNASFDIANSRLQSTKLHPPLIIFIMVGGLCLSSALVAGYGMAGGMERSWIHISCFAIIMSLVFLIIVDLEYPRLGFIRVDDADQILIELRETMN
jgi:hypothetical protein